MYWLYFFYIEVDGFNLYWIKKYIFFLRLWVPITLLQTMHMTELVNDTNQLLPVWIRKWRSWLDVTDRTSFHVPTVTPYYKSWHRWEHCIVGYLCLTPWQGNVLYNLTDQNLLLLYIYYPWTCSGTDHEHYPFGANICQKCLWACRRVRVCSHAHR